MFIQTEETPNPKSLKFLPGCQILESGTADFPSRDSAAQAPLAQRLFDVEGIVSVFFGTDFITLTKQDDKDWIFLKPAVLGAIMEHLTAERPVILEQASHHTDTETDKDYGDQQALVDTIKELIETRVRPAVAQDGGDIVFRDFKDGIVYLHLQGACAGCPSATMTLKAGIENLLKHHVPEVTAVEAVNQ